MTLKTITVKATADTTLVEDAPTFNYGGRDLFSITITDTSKGGRALLRFPIPIFNGKIKSIKLKMPLYTKYGTGYFPVQLFLVDSPQDDLWLEGTANGVVDDNGCSWNNLGKDYDWGTPGGDYAAEPIAYHVFDLGTISGWFEIDIPTENTTLQSNKMYSIIAKAAKEIATVTTGLQCRSKEFDPPGTWTSYLELEIEVDGLDTPTLTANPISSTQLDLSWNKSALNDDNFTHYLLEQSPNGVDTWTTLATITDKDTTSYEDTGLVVQADVNDFNEDSDTYPNGRTKYYRLSVVSSVFGATGYGTANATTIPAIRPVKLSFTPKSKYWNEDFIDDNRAYKPYGVEVIPSWYDSLDITEVNYIDKLTIEAYFRGASTWPGTASETNDFTPVDFDTGGIIEGDTGYKPYKIKGKIYDTGGLYRKCTTDKTNEQFDVTWPAPCPVALPSGALADVPPALSGRPFSAGSLVPIDLSFAGEQSDVKIFEEDFAGITTDKWFDVSSGTTELTYTSINRIHMIINQATAASLSIWKKFKKDLDNDYNKYFDKYTGGYRIKLTGKFGMVVYTAGNSLIAIFYTHGWIANDTANTHGIRLQFHSDNNTIEVIASDNLGSAGDRTLLTQAIAAASNPLASVNAGNYFYLEIIASPLFSASEGMEYVIFWNMATTKIDAENVDLSTLSSDQFFVVTDTGMTGSEQKHYTGRCGVEIESTGNETLARLGLYKYRIDGRVNGQGYGAKNLTKDEIYALVNSPIPTFPIAPSPGLTSELCYIEGRIKNQYGAQSRTGEVDNYQGDTFNNAIPIGFLSVPKTGFVGSDVLIDASQSIDPEGGALIYKYDFGDTSTLETSQSSVSHQYSAIGTYTIKLIVEDEAGLLSVEVQAIIKIYDAVAQFQEVSLMSPWESINQTSPSGTSSTSHPELDYDTIQTMEGGNRAFGLTGQHHDPNCNTPLADRITNAENEKDYFHVLYNKAKLIILDLVNFGKVRGVITDHKPSMAADDQQAFQFSMTFQEIDVRQFE